MYQSKEFSEAGGRMSAGRDIRDHTRRAAGEAVGILKEATPADLPVERPARFELVVNLKTGKAFGRTIPPSVLVRADQAIQ